jgi:phage shock protein A
MDNSFVADKQELKIQELEQQVSFWKSEYENLKIRYDALQKKIEESDEQKLSSALSMSFGVVNEDNSDSSSSVDTASVDNLKLIGNVIEVKYL